MEIVELMLLLFLFLSSNTVISTLVFNKGPVGMDLLAQNRAAFQVFNGILSVLEGLVLHQSVAL